MKRILLIAASTAALGGCSWLGYGDRGYDAATYAATYGAPHGATYAAQKPCCKPTLSKYNFEAAVGPSFIVGGDAVTPDGTNPSTGTALNELDMDDLYDTGVRVEAGVSKMLNPNRKATLMGHYVKHDSAGVQDWGTVNGAPLTGALSDYEAFGAELGLRQYGRISPFPLVRSVRPYVEGRIGASRVDDIAIVNSNIAPNSEIPFYDESWVATGAGLVGVETPFIGRSTLGLETGIRYTAGLDSDNSALAPGNPIRGANNGGEKWTVPVMLRGRFRF